MDTVTMLVTALCFAMTAAGVYFFRKVRAYNPRLAVLIIGAALMIEVLICMMASGEM